MSRGIFQSTCLLPQLRSLYLVGLCVMALSVFQFNPSVQAALITRNVNVTLTAANLESFNLDLDQNGSTDFTFNATLVPDPTLTVGFDVVDFPFASNNGLAIDSLSADGFPLASLLAEGTVVSPSQLYSRASFDQGNLFFTNTLDPATGNFLNRTGFVGFRFDRPDGTNYGFAQVTVNDLNAAVNPLGLSIGVVGYNDVAGQSIQITGIPEPTSLTLIGTGILVAAFRSRRRTPR